MKITEFRHESAAVRKAILASGAGLDAQAYFLSCIEEVVGSPLKDVAFVESLDLGIALGKAMRRAEDGEVALDIDDLWKIKKYCGDLDKLPFAKPVKFPAYATRLLKDSDGFFFVHRNDFTSSLEQLSESAGFELLVRDIQVNYLPPRLIETDISAFLKLAIKWFCSEMKRAGTPPVLEENQGSLILEYDEENESFHTTIKWHYSPERGLYYRIHDLYEMIKILRKSGLRKEIFVEIDEDVMLAAFNACLDLMQNILEHISDQASELEL